MTLDEALSQAVEGARVTATHMQPGCYVEHSFSRGFLRCWPVDMPDKEWLRTQCDFIPHDGDRAADWRILETEEQYPPKPKIVGGWGGVTGVKSREPEKSWDEVFADKTKTKHGTYVDRPPVADVIDLGALERGTTAPESARPMAEPWAKPLDPRKGGW